MGGDGHGTDCGNCSRSSITARSPTVVVCSVHRPGPGQPRQAGYERIPALGLGLKGRLGGYIAPTSTSGSKEGAPWSPFFVWRWAKDSNLWKG